MGGRGYRWCVHNWGIVMSVLGEGSLVGWLIFWVWGGFGVRLYKRVFSKWISLSSDPLFLINVLSSDPLFLINVFDSLIFTHN